MASNAADIITGITVAFGTSGFAAQLTDVKVPGFERVKVDTTHLDQISTDNYRTAIAGKMIELGDLEMSGNLNTDFTNVQTALETASETVTITFNSPGATSKATMVFTGALATFDPQSAGIDEKLTFSASAMVFSKPTITPDV